MEEVVEEPTDSFKNRCAPTIPAEEGHLVPIKHNFKETFDCPIFCGRRRIIMKWVGKKEVIHNVIREEGHPRKEFLREQKLSTNSSPVEFLNHFFLFQKKHLFS